MIMTGNKANFAALSCLIRPIIIPRPRPRPRPSSSSSSSSSSLSLAMVLSVVVLTIILHLLPSCQAAGEAACNPEDGNSLLSFYSTLSSSSTANSLNWNNSSSSNCCSWDGVSCDTVTGRVTRLWLPYKDLNGTLSPSLVNLTALSSLNLSHNRLMGPLPEEFFSSLTSLQFVDLSYNRLSGELPSTNNIITLPIQILDLSSNRFSGQLTIPFLQGAANLTSFNVSNNIFTGQIPSNICTTVSSSVTLLDFSNNNFNGNVPSGLGACPKLEIFRAGFNNLSGTIPDDVYRAVSLQVLSLPVNHLTGDISDDIVNLTRLQILELFSNQLTGMIPREIGKLAGLESLLLYINNLTGTLPPSLNKCTNLVSLNLRVNFLVGDLSSFDFSTLQQLSTLDLGNNNFTGVFPTSLYSCISLTAVRFASNQLEGQISPDITALQSLSFLSVSANNLTNITGAIRILMGCKKLTTLILSNNTVNETLPDYGNALDPAGFQNLQVLSLGGCRLFGQVPSWLSMLRNLQVLDLSFNRITGSIPAWLGNLSGLFYLDLSKNSLTGEFPLELTRLQALVSPQTGKQLNRSYLELPVFVKPDNLTNMQYNQLSSLPPAIYLGQNNLSGSIPPEIGQLKMLHILDVDSNNFSGNIPDELSNLTNLERLDLSSNQFSGEIPASLKVLHFLSWFSVANNNLRGPVPSGGQFDTFSESNFEGNPLLCGQIVQRSCSAPSGTNSSTTDHKSANAKLIVGLVLGICFGTGIVIAVLVLWILSKRRIIPGVDADNMELDTLSSHSYSGLPPQAEKSTNVVVLFPNNTENIKDLTMPELLKATDNFSQANIIGAGGFGLVYKAILEDGTKLAVKKLSGDLGLMEREFKAEQMRNDGKQEQVFDPLLRGKGFDAEMLKVLDVACMCVNHNPFKRPTIQEVVDWLKDVGSDRNQNKG
ncbi:hypothetical protein Tsubulata_027512 [Turnera subulata]|uniref:Leucine-rich repeat-containing N-terminal plant-type domain-containing protein n=1 Tax=Turnera subulata TaxID=218843 RepID=A0A9Q0JK83_9ROSI|nr:hypothetical protein Tsubulata_027512 [Turnera subulata]